MNLDEDYYANETVSLEYYLTQSNILREAEEVTAEIELLKKAISLFKQESQLYFLLGIAQDKINNIDGVINSYSKAIALESRQPFWVYTAIIERLQWQKELDQAVIYSSQGIKLYPQQPELYRQLAIVQEKLGNFSQAISNDLIAIELEPAQPISLYSHLLKLLKDQQEFKSFDKVYSQLIAVHPQHNDSSIFFYLGEYYSFKNSLRKAIEAYYKSLEINPNQDNIIYLLSSLHFNLGVNLLERKNLEAAIKQFQQVELVKEQYKLKLNWPQQNNIPWSQEKWQLKQSFDSLLPPEKKWPKITVVTPSLNQAEYIEETILSVINQEYDNLEYIVVDGLSNDGTADILGQYENQIDRIIIEADRGQSDAINKGFDIGTGELMTWLNSDDLLFPGALYMLALTYLKNECDIVAGICVVHKDSEIIAARKPKVKQQNFNVPNLSDLLHSWSAGHFFFQPETIFTRKLWLEAGGRLNTELNYAMDHDLWLRFACLDAKLEIVSYPTALFRKHDQQKTANSLASISELTKVVEQHHQIQVDSKREKIIRDKFNIFSQLIRPNIAIICQDKSKFSPQTNNDLQTTFFNKECCLFSWKTIQKIGLKSFDFIIVIATPETNAFDINWLREVKFSGILLAWMWTDEQDYYLNSLIAETVDICVPKSKLLGKIVRNNYSLVFPNINICLTECSEKEVRKLFASSTQNKLFDDILMKTEKEQSSGGTFGDSKAFWFEESYFELALEKRFTQLAKYKVCVLPPLKDRQLAVLEALLCGLIIVFVGKASDIEELFLPNDWANLSMLCLNNDDYSELPTTIDYALHIFEQQETSGRKKRYDFVLNNHLLVNRLNSLFEQLPRFLEARNKSSQDKSNQSTKTDMTENQLEATETKHTLPLSFYLEKAQGLLDSKPKEAANLYQQAISFYPDNSLPYRQLGVAQEKQGDIEGQIKSYIKATALESGQPFWVYSVLVNRLQTTQQLEKAVEIANQGIELYPDEAELYRNLGVVQDRQGDTNNLINNYFKAIALDKKQPFWVYCALAEHLCWRGRASEAEKVARQGIEVHPKRSELQRYLGLALQKQGKPNEAIKSYTQAVQLGSNQPAVVYESLVTLYREGNDLTKAIDICQQAIEVLPDQDKSKFVTQLRDLTFLNADRLPVPKAAEPIQKPRSGNISSSDLGSGGNNLFKNLSDDEYVRHLYKAILKREADPKGLEGNLRALKNNAPRTQLLENIFNSAEFASLNSQKMLSDLSNRQFLKAFWKLLLGRDCDPAAEKTYLGHLNNGLSRTQFIVEITKSGEFSDRIENLKLLEENVERNTGSVWIMGTEDYITQDEWDHRLLKVLCDRLSNQKDSIPSNKPKSCTSEIVNQYIALNQAPLVSVITSLFKGKKFIRHFLENITTQTIFSAIELIIIDANSPENEFEIINEYLEKYDNIKYTRTEKTIGIYEAWNVGVEQAKAPFLTNANLDDLRRFDCFEKQAEALLLDKDADLVYQDIFYSLTPNLPFETIEQCGYKTNLPDVATKEVMLEFNPPHSAPMWRKTLHDRVGLFNTGYRSGGDYELWMRALLKDAKFIKIKEATAVYYNNPNGISTRQESHGAYESKEIQVIYQTLFEKDLLSISPEEFICLSRDRLGLSGDADEIQNAENSWQGKITVLDKYFEEKLREMSKNKFYLPLDD